jgi:hypothetical protein
MDLFGKDPFLTIPSFWLGQYISFVHYSLQGMEAAYLQVDLMRKMTLKLMLYTKPLIKEWTIDVKNEGKE